MDVYSFSVYKINKKFSRTRPNGERFYTITNGFDSENLARYEAGDTNQLLLDL